MRRIIFFILLSIIICFIEGCSSGYKIKPLSFKIPSAYNNAVNAAGADIGARAFADPDEAKEAFGFDIRAAGMLPVQVVFDNLGSHTLEINGRQSFLEDKKGNVWPVLSRKIAYERAAKYSETKQIVKEGVSKGLWGAAAGTIIGAAIGIVTGDNVGEAAGKGAAIGAAAGATLGGTGAYVKAGDARKSIINDLQEKSLQNNIIEPKTIAHGFLFFPGEAESAGHLRLQLIETDTGNVHVLRFGF